MRPLTIVTWGVTYMSSAFNVEDMDAFVSANYRQAWEEVPPTTSPGPYSYLLKDFDALADACPPPALSSLVADAMPRIKIEPGTEEPSNDDLTAGNAEQVAADDPIITVPKDVDKPPKPVNIKDYVYAFREQEKLRSVHAANAVPGGDAVLTGKCCDKAGKCGCKSYLKYFTSRF